jgi:hypothetical protein
MKARQIAVRAEDQVGDLRCKSRDDVSEQGFAGKRHERLVRAHAARFAAGENDAANSLG